MQMYIDYDMYKHWIVQLNISIVISLVKYSIQKSGFHNSDPKYTVSINCILYSVTGIQVIYFYLKLNFMRINSVGNIQCFNGIFIIQEAIFHPLILTL